MVHGVLLEKKPSRPRKHSSVNLLPVMILKALSSTSGVLAQIYIGIHVHADDYKNP